MFGIRYVKAAPTTYVLHYKGGRVKREGPGLAFIHFAPSSTVVQVPLHSADVPFVFEESTADFQAVTIQGQLTYRVVQPKQLAALMDFSVGPDGRWLAEDPETLPQRLVQATQVLTRARVGTLDLKEALARGQDLAREVFAELAASPVAGMLGVEVLALVVLAVRPTPEMARALEAGARESLQRQADEALYARRNAAVEQERRIKESELNTELAVEQKRREIRETQVAGEIAVEEQRAALVSQRAQNERTDADAKAYALEASLKPIRETEWRSLMALAARGADPGVTIALAFRELAENAQKIGELNVSPDLLNSLLARRG